MPAQPLHAPVIRSASAIPAPIRTLLERAGLAEPPPSATDLRFDAESRGGREKVLLSFRARRAEINLFVLLSPGLRGSAPARLEEEVRRLAWWPEVRGEGGAAGADASGAAAPSPFLEPDHAWWGPDPDGPGRRHAYSTAGFDFVEVVIEDLSGTVSIRAVN